MMGHIIIKQTRVFAMRRSSTSPQYRIYVLFQQSMEARSSMRHHFAEPEIDFDNLYEELKLALVRNNLMLSFDKTQALNAKAIVQVFQILANYQFEWRDIPDDDREIFLKSLYSYFDSLSPIDLALATWSLGRLGVNINSDTTPAFRHALLSTITNHASQFNQQGYANIMWAFVAMDFDFESLRDIYMRLILRVRIDLENDQGFSQADDRYLAQVKDFLSYYHDQFPENFRAMLDNLNTILDNRLRSQPPHSSFTHLQIARLIQRHCADTFSNEVWIAGSPVDICFPDQRVVLEIDGPQHFNWHNKSNVHTQIRQRIIEKCGYTVFRIDCRQWARLSTWEKNDALSELLLAAGLRLRDAPLSLESGVDTLMKALPLPLPPSPSTEEEETHAAVAVD